MTPEQIKVMTTPQLRKAIKNAGFDPMSEEFSKGNPESMRAFLYALYLPPAKIAPESENVTVNEALQIGKDRADAAFAALQEEHEIAQPLYGAQAISAARNGAPVLPMSSDSYEQFKDRRMQAEQSVVHKNFDDRITTLELRIATLEQMLKISNSYTVAAPAQPDPYAALAQYLHATEDGPELVLTVAQVPDLTLEQKLLVLKLFGEPTYSSATPTKTLNQAIVTALQKTK